MPISPALDSDPADCRAVLVAATRWDDACAVPPRSPGRTAAHMRPLATCMGRDVPAAGHIAVATAPENGRRWHGHEMEERS